MPPANEPDRLYQPLLRTLEPRSFGTLLERLLATADEVVD